MAHHRHFDRTRRASRILHAMDYLRRGKKEDNHNEDRQNGSGQFHLVAAVDLRGLAIIVLLSLAKTNDRVGEQAENDHKDCALNFELEDRQPENGMSRRRIGRKDIRRAEWPARRSRQN